MSTISAGTTTPTALSLSGDTTGALTFQVNGTTTAATITSAGNVGIGTASPRSKLDVSGSIYTSWSDTNFIGMQFGNDPSDYRLGLLPVSSQRDLQIYCKSNDGFGVSGITFHTGSTPSERMRITSGGNVGIGTASPDAKLTVSGGAASFADGTSSAPAIANAGDLDTGVYFPAANEVAVTTGGTVAAAFNSNGLFFRNRIINGDMRIAQRGTAAVTTSQAFPVDRFRVPNGTDGAFSAQQDSSAPTGFTNSLKYTVTTADTNLTTTQNTNVTQVIEGTNIADLAWGTANARTVTLSFWVRSSLTGTFGGGLRNGDATRSYPFTYSISAANTWEYKTITIAGDTSGTWSTGTNEGVGISFSLGAGPDASGTAGAWNSNNNPAATGQTQVIGTLNATWYVTGVQFEIGSVATPFERRPYGTELQLCQRYYERLNSQYMAFIANASYLSNPYSIFRFLVQKRAAPTLSTVTGASLTNLLDRFGLGLITPTASTTNNITAFSCRVEFTTSASYTVGESFSVVNDYWQASAEL